MYLTSMIKWSGCKKILQGDKKKFKEETRNLHDNRYPFKIFFFFMFKLITCFPPPDVIYMDSQEQSSKVSSVNLAPLVPTQCPHYETPSSG